MANETKQEQKAADSEGELKPELTSAPTDVRHEYQSTAAERAAYWFEMNPNLYR